MTVRFSLVRRGWLEDCAPGHAISEKLHHKWIRFQGRVVRDFPKGPGAGSSDFDVDIHQVRKLVRHLLIDYDCANGHIPRLARIGKSV